MNVFDCPACGGRLCELGCLGWLRWFKCENCGGECSKEVPRKKKVVHPTPK